MLKTKPKKTGKRLEDLCGMLKHDGPPIPIKELCKPVDYSADWKKSEKRSDSSHQHWWRGNRALPRKCGYCRFNALASINFAAIPSNDNPTHRQETTHADSDS